MMFQTITSVQKGEALPLQKSIDNRTGAMRVALRAITYTVGWHNVHAGETFSWRPAAGGEVGNFDLTPGLYGFSDLREALDAAHASMRLMVSRVNGLVNLLVEVGWEVRLTDGLLGLLGLDDGLGGQWLSAGSYIGDRPVNFTPLKELQIRLKQLDSQSTVADGGLSNNLATIGLGESLCFGDIRSQRFTSPEFKRLESGTISELEITVTDDKGAVVDNNGLPISVVLEFC